MNPITLTTTTAAPTEVPQPQDEYDNGTSFLPSTQFQVLTDPPSPTRYTRLRLRDYVAASFIHQIGAHFTLIQSYISKEHG